MVFKAFSWNYKKANGKIFHKYIFHHTIIQLLAARNSNGLSLHFAIKLKNCSFWPVFGNQSTKCTVSALHRGNDNLLRAEFISGKNLLESLPKENFSSQPVVDLWFRSQFYIQLVFKAPLCITLMISYQKIVSGSLFFQLFQKKIYIYKSHFM